MINQGWMRLEASVEINGWCGGGGGGGSSDAKGAKWASRVDMLLQVDVGRDSSTIGWYCRGRVSVSWNE